MSTLKTVALGFAWRRSRWGHICPVALKEGRMIPGIPEFSVGCVICKSYGKSLSYSSMDGLKDQNFLFVLKLQFQRQVLHHLISGGLQEVHHKPSKIFASSNAQTPL